MLKILLPLFGTLLSGYLFAQGPACTSFPLPTDPPLTPTPGLMNYLQLKGIVPNPCVGVPDLPDPTLENAGCYAPVERYMARPVMVDDLVQGLNFQPCPCNANGLQGVPIGSTAIPATPYPCMPAPVPCPNNTTDFGSLLPYFEDIGMLVQLQATQALLAGKQFGGGNDWDLTGGFYANIRQVAVDINAAFDCAHLRRPSIQGQITETFSIITTNKIIICPDVINSFLKAGDPALEIGSPTRSTYIDANGDPRTDVYFSTCNIVNTIPPYNCTNPDRLVPDIAKIECRLWFFHVSKAYIDAGYTSCAMGQNSLWAVNDIVDGEYDDTYRTLSVIRKYAAQHHSMFLMTGEPHLNGPEPVVPDTRPGHTGENIFLWDYDSRPLRPREVTDPPTQDPELNNPVCGSNVAYNESDKEIFNPGHPCYSDRALAAVVDLCHLENFAHHISGNSPTTLCPYAELPFEVYFDYGPGEFILGPGESGNGWSEPGNAGPGTWGYSDSNWLAELSPACQEAWLAEMVCRIRDLTNGLGFFCIPGRVRTPQRDANGVSVLENHNLYSSMYNSSVIKDSGFKEQAYRMMENPSIVTALQAEYKINDELEIETTSECIVKACTPYCPSQYEKPDEESRSSTPDKFFLVRQTLYHFCVKSPDCTSTYTWHIRRGANDWLPFHRGECFDFLPSTPGTYVIGLRQDNLALDYSTYGAAVVPADITINVQVPDANCPCVKVPECVFKPPFSSECISSTIDKNRFNFTILIPENTTGEPLLLAREGKIEQYSFSTQTKNVTGILAIANTGKESVLDIDVSYGSPGVGILSNKFNVYQELPDCPKFEALSRTILRTSSRLMPVPVDDVLKVVSDSKSEEESRIYKIINSAGEIAQAGRLTESAAQLKVSHLPNGVYFLQIMSPSDGEHEYLRFIIAR